jgi:hypothetical protein
MSNQTILYVITDTKIEKYSYHFFWNKVRTSEDFKNHTQKWGWTSDVKSATKTAKNRGLLK